MKIKAYPTTVTGLPANPKFIELPCGCRGINPELHVVRNEALNIVLAQCKQCKTIIDLSPVSAIKNVS